MPFGVDVAVEGIYTVMNFSGDKGILTELNRVFRFDDAVLRHLIVVDAHPPASEERGTGKEDEEQHNGD